MRMKTWSGLWLVAALMSSPAVAIAEDLSGIIATTRTIREDSRLVGDVTCTVTGAPCITFGAPHISLRLNGFTITGLADPATGCNGTTQAGEHGISTNSQADVEVRGPGIVRHFRAVGVFFTGTLFGRIDDVTITTNCQAGILINTTSSRITVATNLAIRNGSAQPGFPCGGIWIQGSDNSLRWNETTGNGFANPNDDFGIGIQNGNNNLVEENTALGNSNGIVVFPAATNTRLRRNIAVGNPAIQAATGVQGSVGVDIWDQSAPGATTFDGNLCVTSINAPCPNVAPGAVPRKPGGH